MLHYAVCFFAAWHYSFPSKSKHLPHYHVSKHLQHVLLQLLKNVTTQECTNFPKIPVHAVKTYTPKGKRGIAPLVLNHSSRRRWDYLREDMRYQMSEPQRRSWRFLRREAPERPLLSLVAIPPALLRLFQKFKIHLKILGVKNDDVSSILSTETPLPPTRFSRHGDLSPRILRPQYPICTAVFW